MPIVGYYILGHDFGSASLAMFACSVKSVPQAAGDQNEAGAEFLPQMKHLEMWKESSPNRLAMLFTFVHYGWLPQWPRQGLHLADPKSGLEALGECQDSVWTLQPIDTFWYLWKGSIDRV